MNDEELSGFCPKLAGITFLRLLSSMSLSPLMLKLIEKSRLILIFSLSPIYCLNEAIIKTHHPRRHREHLIHVDRSTQTTYLKVRLRSGSRLGLDNRGKRAE